MTKFSLLILAVICDNDAVFASKSISIHQILQLIPEKQRKTYSTTYRHCKSMVGRGYLACGLDDGAASTYYITDSGIAFYKAQSE